VLHVGERVAVGKTVIEKVTVLVDVLFLQE